MRQKKGEGKREAGWQRETARGGDEKRKRDGVERGSERQVAGRGEKARQHGVLTPPPDDFERFVLPGSAESLANAAG